MKKTLAIKIKGFKISEYIENFYDILETIGRGRFFLIIDFRFIWRSLKTVIFNK